MFVGNFKGNIPQCDLKTLKQYGGIACNECSYYKDGEIEIIFQGSLYNKPRLGLENITNDAEVVFLLYKQTKCFSRLDGSFTFIITDNRSTIIVRDHHGTNSQVYYNDNYFASSLSLLRKSPDCSSSINRKALGSFLSIGYISSGETSFENIHKLNAGTMLIYKDGKCSTKNLFDTSLIVPVECDNDINALSEQYATLHSQSIRRRIDGKDNIGILLSGGYDSGANLAALRKIYNGDIRSYTVGFKGDNWSELPLAQCMSDKFGTIHKQYEIDGSEIFALPDIVRTFGDPFVEGGLMVNYTAMRMIGTAKPDVILGGDGNDQYFGTSAREIAIHYLAAKYGVKPLLTATYNILSHDIFDRSNTSYRIRFHLSKILNILQGDMFGFERFNLHKLLNDTNSMPIKEHVKYDCRSFEHLYTQHAYQTDLEKTINQVILFKASQTAQMFDNKIAFPFMDLELYKFLEHLPVRYKCQGDTAFKIARGESTSKILLKHHYRSLLPEAITSKRKQGGFAPMPIFFKEKAQRSKLADYIMQSSLTDEYLNRLYVEQFIKKYDTEADDTSKWFWYKQNNAIKYFNLLTLAIWWEQFVKLKESTLI